MGGGSGRGRRGGGAGTGSRGRRTGRGAAREASRRKPATGPSACPRRRRAARQTLRWGRVSTGRLRPAGSPGSCQRPRGPQPRLRLADAKRCRTHRPPPRRRRGQPGRSARARPGRSTRHRISVGPSRCLRGIGGMSTHVQICEKTVPRLRVVPENSRMTCVDCVKPTGVQPQRRYAFQPPCFPRSDPSPGSLSPSMAS